MTFLKFLTLLGLVPLIAAAHSHGNEHAKHHTRAVNATADTKYLKTWWHDSGEINNETTVQDGNVRKSHVYMIQAATHGASTAYYNSFVYETIPGNGMSSQMSNAARIGETQAWTSFLYNANTTIRISRKGLKPAAITIRPTTLKFTTTSDTEYTYITIPYSADGYRFSVEFSDDLRSLMPSGSREPWNALLIFASPFEAAADIPAESDAALVVPQGLVTGLETTTAKTVIFKPGVYYTTGAAQLNLSSSVDWIYFAPGAYVKGAVEFTSKASVVKATGHGILSGEQYVYYANPQYGFTNGGPVNNGLRMWSGNNGNNKQTFYLHGPTINSAPFNSMDWSGGNVNLMTVDANDYKQVGSYFPQTDGLENYPGSHVRNIFYHVNDDTLKTYYSNVLIQNVVVWKLATAPVVQFGWSSRELTNITVDSIDVIHQAYTAADNNPGLIGSDNNYADTDNGISSNHRTADVANTMSNVTFSNFRAEGPSACLFRIYALENLQNVRIENVYIEEFEPLPINTTQSLLPEFYDASTGVPVTVEDFVIKDFYVGSTLITKANAVSVGRMDIDECYVADVTFTS